MNRLSGAILIVLISFGFMQSSLAATPLTQYSDILVAKGAPQSVLLAAQDLQYHLAKIAGREIPLLRGKAANVADGKHFYVGPGFWPEHDARTAKMGPEGYLQVSVADGLLLSGGDGGTYEGGVAQGSGVYHAVSLFLQDQCGVDWLWPGESGEVIPHNPSLVVPQLNRSGTPVLQTRYVKFYTGAYWTPGQVDEVQKWQRRTLQGDEMAAGFGHSWHTVLDENLYFKEHPEWYALVNGQRSFAQICPSNLEMRQEFVKRLLSIPSNQKLNVLSVSASDGYGFCECPLCRAKSSDQTTYAEYISANEKAGVDEASRENVGYQGFQNAAYWDFVNDIAKRVKELRPDLGIGAYAYTNSRQPPKNIARLPDNVYISVTSYATQLMLPGTAADYDDYISSWKAKGVKLSIREYWGMHYWMDLPVLYPREIADEIKKTQAAGAISIFGEAGKNFSTQALNYYVCAHQLWDPQGADPDKSMARFYSAFGPAASDVRNYFEVLSDGVHRTWRKKKLAAAYVRVISSLDEMFDKQTLARAKAALDAADARAGNDAILKKRLAFLRAGYDYTVLMTQLLGLYEKLGRTGFPLEFFEWQATAEGARRVTKDPGFSARREFFEANLRQPFSYTLEEQDAWLRQAWELGQKRIQMLNANRGTFALEEGTYASRNVVKGNYGWHSTVAKYLGKEDSDIEPLQFTPKPAKPAPAAAAAPQTKPEG